MNRDRLLADSAAGRTDQVGTLQIVLFLLVFDVKVVATDADHGCD